jgi:hypothetical protein
MSTKWYVVAALLIAVAVIGIVHYVLNKTEITVQVTVSEAADESPLSGVRVAVRGDTIKTNEQGRAKFTQNVREGDTLVVATLGQWDTRIIRRVIVSKDLSEGARWVRIAVMLSDNVTPNVGFVHVDSPQSPGVKVALDDGPDVDVPATFRLSVGGHTFRFSKRNHSSLDTTVMIGPDTLRLLASLPKTMVSPSPIPVPIPSPVPRPTPSPVPARVPSPTPTPIRRGSLEDALASLDNDAGVIQALENCDETKFSADQKGLRQFLLGQAYLNVGEGEKAIAILKEYVGRYGKNDPIGYYLWAEAEMRHGDLQIAIDAYKGVEQRKHYLSSAKRDSICGECMFGEASAYLALSRQKNNEQASEYAANAESLFEEFLEDFCGHHPKCEAANTYLKELRER